MYDTDKIGDLYQAVTYVICSIVVVLMFMITLTEKLQVYIILGILTVPISTKSNSITRACKLIYMKNKQDICHFTCLTLVL